MSMTMFIGISDAPPSFLLQITGCPPSDTWVKNASSGGVWDLTDVGHSVGLPGFNIANGPLSTVSRTASEPG